MIPTLPSVQHNCKDIHITGKGSAKRKGKRIANKRHRKALNMATQRLQADPDSFDDEGFNAPSYSDYDID
jgi:hypothetical protein